MIGILTLPGVTVLMFSLGKQNQTLSTLNSLA